MLNTLELERGKAGIPNWGRKPPEPSILLPYTLPATGPPSLNDWQNIKEYEKEMPHPSKYLSLFVKIISFQKSTFLIFMKAIL